ncbi:MAG: metallophosphoesterase [Pseudomonadota bacterium]
MKRRSNELFRTILNGIMAQCALLGALNGGTSAQELPPNETRHPIVIIGDTPYSSQDEAMLAKALPIIADGSFPFVLHIGDYKAGKADCIDAHDEGFSNLVKSLQPKPVFYTPGDNEWTDCDRNTNPKTNKPYSDLSRLDRVLSLFAQGTPSGAEAFAHRRQDRQTENATWTHAGIRYLTIHVTGTNNGRDWVTGDPLEAALKAVEARDEANKDWLEDVFALAAREKANAIVLATHGDMTDVGKKPVGIMCNDVALSDQHPCDAFVELRNIIRKLTIDFGKPVLLIHGDTEPFTLGQSFAGDEAPNLWRLNATGDAGRTPFGIPFGVRDITILEFQLDKEIPFRARGLLTGKKPARR